MYIRHFWISIDELDLSIIQFIHIQQCSLVLPYLQYAFFFLDNRKPTFDILCNVGDPILFSDIIITEKKINHKISIDIKN